MNIKRVTVAGSGVLGSQIAFQTAFQGFSVSVYDINDEAVHKARDRFNALKARYLEDEYGTEKELDAASNRISSYTDLAASVEQADLVIEAIPEVLEVKQGFYEHLSRVARKEAIFASNSSTFIPSQLIDHTDRPEKYLHLHFANDISKLNVAEVMKHPGTSSEVFDEVIEFAKAIAMVPIPIHKEQPGYVLNTLLVPFLRAALELVVDGVAEPETVDKTWMISSRAPLGPFGFLDMIGPNTPYNLNKAYAEAGDEGAARIAEWLKREFLDKGRMGKQNGKGIYTYPNPAFESPGFLK
ncbi:3-hydroxyacyl-CoA dehydrogenase [Halopseudomonas pelagia]|uniref:3-hydroxyacyl-CoA dehydrogenase n=1 Tax=Halopseudomonas pelagia TaxID=553151 RepID=A0AA91Z928_9GAMM|nr:3-hydroxyacyl-CoA dehydrogenase [Halopseudomonas pelagia]PCD01431.1 3-hydroxybutyryl-CoA dehydrogenase [Halopseudomonas pelagia]QFY55010.1 3-hydroxyacyl-CoA dehydrogenase [Halopseudomonas pelagia]